MIHETSILIILCVYDYCLNNCLYHAPLGVTSSSVIILVSYKNSCTISNNNYYFSYSFSIGAVLNHLADILSSPSLSTAEDLKNLPQDYRDYKRNLTKFLAHAQNVDSKWICRI